MVSPIYIYLFLLSVNVFSVHAKKTTDGLYLIHVICRHGERTPVQSYPNDIHNKEKFYPVGFGQLTNDGKTRMYNVGNYLKKRYQKFLGNFYLPYQVEIQASVIKCTQTTAQLLIAGMYPPKTAQVWNQNLSWQPIPITYADAENDRIFLPNQSCGRFTTMQRVNVEQAKKAGKFDRYEKLFNTLHKNSGLRMDVPEDVMRLYDTLMCQKDWGLKLPEWTKDVFPEHMLEVTERYWANYASTNELKKFSAGFMLKKIIDDIKMKINGTEAHKYMKLYVYSGDDSNIVPMLQLFDVYDPHIIPYGAYILLEIHKNGRDFFVKLYYQNNKSLLPRIMHLPDCPIPCKFDKFADAYKKYLPEACMC